MIEKQKIKVKDNDALVRDSFSKAVINVDQSAYQSAKIRRKAIKESDERLSRVENSIDEIKTSIAKLSDLLLSSNQIDK